MKGGITTLSSASDLLPHLPLSAVTVVLLTAFWSFETDSARQALHVASTLVDCDPSSVSYYEIPISVYELDDTAPLSAWAGVPWTEAYRAASAARNVTQGVPFLPAIRVFRNHGGGIVPHTHMDTFAPGALASHITLHCAAQGGKKEGGTLAELSRYTMPVSKDRFAREMRKDEFRSLGVLFLVSGGAKGIVDREMRRWDVIARGVAAVNEGKVEKQDLRRRWIVSIVDVEKEREMAERNTFVDEEPGVVLVDMTKDRTETIRIREDASWEWMRDALLRFEQRQKVTAKRKVAGLKEVVDDEGDRKKILSFLKQGAKWHPMFSRECRLCLSAYLSGDMSEGGSNECDGHVVLVAYASWCGFSQRVMGVYRRLGERGVATVLVGEHEMDLLPGFLDEMVDGFPTVLLVREEDDGGVRVEEFEGPHHMQAVMAQAGDAG